MPMRCRRPMATSLFAILASLSLAGAPTSAQETEETKEENGDDEKEPIEEVVVVGTPVERYRVQESDALTGFPVDMAELPRTIEVVPEQIILDQKAEDLNEVLRNVAGVTEGDGFGGTRDDFLIRGFRRFNKFRNGIEVGGTFRTIPSNVERIEVIKGPGSITFGRVEPGGVVNIVTKKPKPEPRYFFEARAGEEEDFFFLADINAPLTSDGSLQARLNASLQDSESFRNFTKIESEVIAPSVRWAPMEGTAFTLSYTYRTDDRPLDRGFVTLPDGEGGRVVPEDIPRSRRFGEPWEVRETEDHRFELNAEHSFAPDWKVEFTGLYEDTDSFDLQARPLSVTPDGTLIRRADGTQDRDTRTYYFGGNLVGNFETAGLEHQVVAGATFRREKVDRVFGIGNTHARFNIFDPEFGQLSPELNTFLPFDFDAEDYGFSFQDMISIGEKWRILGGLRYDVSDMRRSLVLPDGSELTFPTGRKDEISPQAGVTYLLNDWTSLYASYSESFFPTMVSNPPEPGATLEPETGRQWETGAKFNLANKRLDLVFSFFDLVKDNVAETVDSPMGPVQRPIGKVRSRGFEATARGEVVPGLNVIGAYSFIDNEITETSSDQTGNRNANVAKHKFNLWGSYEIEDGPLRGLGLGAGVTFVGDRYGNTDNSFELDSYTLVDASAWYFVPLGDLGIGGARTGQLKFQINLKNITDERFFPAAGSPLRISVGRPFTALGSVSLMF